MLPIIITPAYSMTLNKSLISSGVAYSIRTRNLSSLHFWNVTKKSCASKLSRVNGPYWFLNIYTLHCTSLYPIQYLRGSIWDIPMLPVAPTLPLQRCTFLSPRSRVLAWPKKMSATLGFPTKNLQPETCIWHTENILVEKEKQHLKKKN